MQEIDAYEEQQTTRIGPARMDLTLFAEEASQVHSIAKALAGTSFVPKAMQGKPDEITAAILYGREIGLDPMMALQTLNVIEGRPTMTANALRGIAQAAGVKFNVLISTATRCRMSARAPGDQQWTESDWTMDRAKQMGLTDKSNWKKMPTAMLVARATSELCRLVAANVLIGMPYSAEELDDLPYEDQRNANGDGGSEDTADNTTRRTVRRAPVKATVPVAEPDPEPYVPQVETPKEIGPPIAGTDRQMINANLRKALMATFNDLNITSRNDRLAKVSEILGREIHSVNQIDDAEGHQVLNALTGRDDDWPDVAPPPQ